MKRNSHILGIGKITVRFREERKIYIGKEAIQDTKKRIKTIRKTGRVIYDQLDRRNLRR